MNEWLANKVAASMSVFCVVGVCIFVFLSLGLFQIKVDNDYRAFIGEGNKALEASDWISERQGDGQESLILLYVPEQELYSTASFLQYATAIQRAEELPYVASVQSLFDQEKVVTDFERSQVKAAPIAFGEDLFSDEGLAQFSTLVPNLPNVSKRFISGESNSAAILITVDFDDGVGTRRTKIEELKTATAKIEQDLQLLAPGDELLLTGSTLFDHAALEVVRQDLRMIFPIALVMIVLIIFLIFRSFALTAVLFALVVLPMLASAGLAGYLNLSLSNLSIAGLLLVGTLAVADVLHLSNSFYAHRTEGVPARQAVIEALKLNQIPILATTVTTVFAQLALLFSPSEPIVVMAYIVMFGAWLAMLGCIFCLPFLLVRIQAASQTVLSLADWLARIADYSARKSTQVLTLATLVVAILLYGGLQTKINDSLAGWFAPDTDFSRSQNLIETGYLGADTVTLVLPSSLNDLVNVRQAIRNKAEVPVFQALATTLDTQPGYWYTPFTNRRALERLIQQENPGVVLDGQRLADVKAFSTETLVKAGVYTKLETGRADYALWYFDGHNADSFAQIEQASEILATAKTLVDENEGSQVRLAGIGLALAQLSAENFDAMVNGSIVIFVLVAVCMFGVFRRLKLGIVSIVPNTLPLVASFGMWGWLGGEFNLAATTVYSVSFGIIVDDTIHIILKFRKQLELGQPVESAISNSIRQCGVGIFATTLIISGGFAMLGASDFLLTAERSSLAALCISSALIFDLTVLPALLGLLFRGTSRQEYRTAH